MKKHQDELDYKLKGLTNDQHRQVWMSATVPLCESIGIKGPADFDTSKGQYAIDYEFPVQYDPQEKRWLFDQAITWDEVFQRWKKRGPMNAKYIEMIQGDKHDVFRGMNW